MQYVDGFVLPVATKNIAVYRRMARKAGKVWIEHGALEFRECIADDLKVQMGPGFPAIVKPKKGETVIFSWIVYKSKKDRDRVMKKVMADPRIHMDPKSMPFDMARMVYGGFKTLVSF